MILIGRLPVTPPHPYEVVVEWLRTKHPDLAQHFVLCTLPSKLPNPSPFKLLVQWIQDPLDVTDPFAFFQALELQSACDDQGIPIVNRVELHKNTAKTAAYGRLSEAGIETPKVYAFESKEEYLAALPQMQFPIILREDVGHAGEFLLLKSAFEGRGAPYEKFYRPVLSEYTDVKGADGRYRKYRCVVAGSRAISHHVQTSETWLTRGGNRIKDGQSREEEIAYISEPDPHAETMLGVARALELDYVGIDYGIDPTGKVIIWEANQFPHLHFSKVDLIYRNFAMERTIAALVLFYLQRAGIEPTPKLIEQASYL